MLNQATPKRRRYLMSEHGHASQGRDRGNYLVKSGRARVERPSYDDGGTTVRILPQRSPDDPRVWDPYRFSTRPLDFGDWIRKYPVCRNYGVPDPVTFILYDPSDPTISRDYVQNTPGGLLYYAISRAVRSGQEQPGWGALLSGGPGRSAPLSEPTEVYLLQCFVMQSRWDKCVPPRGMRPEDRAIVLELTRNTGQTLLAEFDKVKQDYDGPQDDWEAMMVHGDPVSLRHGRFVTFYNLNRDPRRVTHAGQPQGATNASRDWFSASHGTGTQREERAGYGVYIEPTFDGMSADLSQYESVVATKVQPWDEILYFPTLEEQAHLLADRFPPNAILYAWRDHPEWIPESVRRRATNARTFPAPYIPEQLPPGGQAFGVDGYGQRAPTAWETAPWEAAQPSVNPPAAAPPQGNPWGVPPDAPVPGPAAAGPVPSVPLPTASNPDDEPDVPPAGQPAPIQPRSPNGWGLPDPALPPTGIPANAAGGAPAGPQPAVSWGIPVTNTGVLPAEPAVAQPPVAPPVGGAMDARAAAALALARARQAAANN